ncbi:MAG: TIGR01777 family oxidoreductase [Sphingomonadales bacterium]
MANQKTVLISGGTGMIGSALVPVLLQKGYQLILLTRRRIATDMPYAAHPNVHYAYWDPATFEIDSDVVTKADHVVHLAGANVAEKRWTTERKNEINNSRVQSGRLLVDAIKKSIHQPLSFVSASAIGWYGPDTKEGSVPFTENDPADSSFLGDTCRAWEDSTAALVPMNIRRVVLRIGIVLSRKGGALAEFEKPLRVGVAPLLGSGEQIISWIQLQDLVSMILFSLEQTSMQGIYNAVAPAPVSQRSLMMTLTRQRKRFFITVKIPAFFLQVMLGEMSIEVLKSATVSSNKIQQAGFCFHYPSIEKALPVC